MMGPLIYLLPLLVTTASVGAEPSVDPIRVGVLAFGTVNWELAALENDASARSSGVRIVPVNLATSEAAKIALLANNVDVIIADWIWVALQRGQGRDLAFVPYSTSHGALMVPKDSPIRWVPDLKGRKLGIAGGGFDKNWLLLQLVARKKYGIDLDHAVEKTFGAPPLLNQQFLQGNLDAVLNYWHYAATLEARGYRTLLDGRTMLRDLDIDAALPNIGYVFHAVWAKQHRTLLKAFIETADRARGRLCENDDAWQKLAPPTQEADPKAQALLRQRYCEGRVTQWGKAEMDAAAKIFGMLPRVAGETVTGKARELPAGVFWSFAPP